MYKSQVPHGGGVTPTVGESGAKQQNTVQDRPADNRIFFYRRSGLFQPCLQQQKWIVFNKTLRHKRIFFKMTLGVFDLFDPGIFSQNKTNANQVVFVAKAIRP